MMGHEAQREDSGYEALEGQESSVSTKESSKKETPNLYSTQTTWYLRPGLLYKGQEGPPSEKT